MSEKEAKKLFDTEWWRLKNRGISVAVQWQPRGEVRVKVISGTKDVMDKCFKFSSMLNASVCVSDILTELDFIKDKDIEDNIAKEKIKEEIKYLLNQKRYKCYLKEQKRNRSALWIL